jgi:hypothetical protein
MDRETPYLFIGSYWRKLLVITLSTVLDIEESRRKYLYYRVKEFNIIDFYMINFYIIIKIKIPFYYFKVILIYIAFYIYL